VASRQRLRGDLAFLLTAEQRQTTLCLAVLWFALCYGSYGIGSWILAIFEQIGVRVATLVRTMLRDCSVLAPRVPGGGSNPRPAHGTPMHTPCSVNR
jgi:hypothetical protein